MNATHVINNDDSALYFIELAIKDPSLSALDIKLVDWPVINLVITGDKFDESLTTSVMVGIISLQKAIHHSYAQLKYGDSSKRLTESEKQRLEISVKVTKGSSKVLICLVGAFSEILKEVATVDPTVAVLGGVGLAIVIASSLGVKHYISARKDIRLAEIKSESDVKILEATAVLSVEETRRLKIVTDAISGSPKSAPILQIADNGKHDLLKSLSTADSVDIEGLKLSSDIIETLVSGERTKSIDERLDGTFKVLRVDSSKADLFIVRLEKKEGGLIFDAVVQDESSNNDIKSLIQKAEWNRFYLDLSINCKILRGGISSAVIIKASKHVMA